MLEMARLDVQPTPRNFELWFTHLSGSNPNLSLRIDQLLNERAVVTPAVLELLYMAGGRPDTADSQLAADAMALDDSADEAVHALADNADQLRHYGNVLCHWSRELGQGQTLGSLVEAVSALTAETARASERNRQLEQKLCAASSRISRLKDSLAESRLVATTDELTGLFNRKAFDCQLRRALSEARAHDQPLSVLLLDVDHFKRVNDVYGHFTGDLVLRLIGRILSDSMKGRDTSARYGGEEFAVILMGADLAAAAIVGNQIRTLLESKKLVHRRTGERIGAVTISVGAAQVQNRESGASLLQRADLALYRAKAQGRNKLCTA